MKILFYGDSITDMGRNRDEGSDWLRLGGGYPAFVAGRLQFESSEKYRFENRGISGNTIIDIYSRMKSDIWKVEPDVLSILIGANDIWREVDKKGGVTVKRYEGIYRMLIEDVLERLPNTKIMLMEPFVLHGTATDVDYEGFRKITEYADVVKKLVREYGLTFVPLQDKFDELAKAHAPEIYLWDGVHPNAPGAYAIAEEWIKAFKKEIDR